MSFRDWSLLVAAIAHLALALLSVSRAGKNPLALPLSLLAFDFFGWTFATLCNRQLVSPLWRPLDMVFTALAPPLVLHVVLTFVGKRRANGRALGLAYALFAALAVSSVPAFFTRWGVSWIESPVWVALFLGGWLPTAIWELWFLLRHLRSGVDADEQARTRLVLAALLVGGAFASTDLWHDLGAPIAALTPFGTVLSTMLLAVVALRFRLFDRNLASTTTLYALSVAAAAVLSYLAIFQGLRGSLPALTFGVTVVTLILGAVVREATTSLAATRERLERLAVLGRFSAQMVHDLKNPLAALVGAAQVLDAEPGDGREFRTMIMEQAARLRTIVERYERLGRVEPVRSLVTINELVRCVTAPLRRAPAEHVAVVLDLDTELADCDLDPDLVSGALENLVRNATEAMSNGGTLTVRTRRESHGERGFVVVITVEDTGEGMDARQAERAFDDFFTTKVAGSGLGLPFVRRVALAHGGDVSLASSRGAGTKVEMRLPGG